MERACWSHQAGLWGLLWPNTSNPRDPAALLLVPEGNLPPCQPLWSISGGIWPLSHALCSHLTEDLYRQGKSQQLPLPKGSLL